jgi:hypothetical protein
MIFKHIKALEQPHYYIVTINQTIVTLDTIILEVVLFSQMIIKIISFLEDFLAEVTCEY